MIDFHVHLLPGIDDGSRDKMMSVAMLEESERQGIKISVATPHFYFDCQTEKMLEKREKAYKVLEKHYSKIEKDMPEIRLGFEVYLSESILLEEDISKLTIADTDTLLIEMPHKNWDDKVFDRLDFLKTTKFDVVLAHPERYVGYVSANDYEKLFSYGFVGQLDAASIITPTTRDIAYKLIEDGKITLIGSDAHNTGIRGNLMKMANEFISKRLGIKYVEMMNETAMHYLRLK